MTRLEALCVALGWQGATIHQAARETGVNVDSLLYSNPDDITLGSDYSYGWFSGRTCSLEHNRRENFPKYYGSRDFWLGVADGIIANNTS